MHGPLEVDLARPRPRLAQVFAYALPLIVVGIVTGPITGILPSLYAKHAQVSLAAVGTLFVAARIFDAITDPLIGYWSDQTRSRWGARKPWIAAGAVLIAVAVYFLYRIPHEAGIVYFAGWAMLFYLGSTLLHVPHMAWGSELSTDYLLRSRIFTVRSIFESAGSLLYTVLPIALFKLGVVPSTSFNPTVFAWVGPAVLLAMPITAWIALRGAPASEVIVKRRAGLSELYGSVRRNKPLLRFLAAHVLAGVGTGCFAALFFPYFDSYAQLGEKLPLLMLVVFVSALASMPVWQKVIEWSSKHRAWAVGWITHSLGTASLLWLEPGEKDLPFAMVAMVLIGVGSGASALAPFALLGDVVDYDLLKTRVDRAGNYYAFLLLIAKVAGSAGGLAFIIVGTLFGYRMGAHVVNTPLAQHGLALMFCFVPACLQLIAVPLIWNFPIDRRRHEIIRRRLEARAKESRA